MQSFGTEVAAGATTALTWPLLKPGTYLLESGTHPSIQVPMGLYGILVVTAAPTATAGVETAAGQRLSRRHCGYLRGSYDAEVPLALERNRPGAEQRRSTRRSIPPDSARRRSGPASREAAAIRLQATAYLTCYPPAVNYTPLYYMINGVAFNKTNASGSLFPITPATIAPAAQAPPGTVLVRMVNAGLRMHVPVDRRIAGGGRNGSDKSHRYRFQGHRRRRQSSSRRSQDQERSVHGRGQDLRRHDQWTVDVRHHTSRRTRTLSPSIDRELSLSGNATARDAGMLAYIGINGAHCRQPATGAFAAAVARADTYNALVAGRDAHRVRSVQGRDRQRHQRLWR